MVLIEKIFIDQFAVLYKIGILNLSILIASYSYWRYIQIIFGVVPKKLVIDSSESIHIVSYAPGIKHS